MVGSMVAHKQTYAGEGAKGPTSGSTGSRREWDTGPGLSFWDLKVHTQWHTYSNKSTPPNHAIPVSLWGPFSFKLPQEGCWNLSFRWFAGSSPVPKPSPPACFLQFPFLVSLQLESCKVLFLNFSTALMVVVWVFSTPALKSHSLEGYLFSVSSKLFPVLTSSDFISGSQFMSFMKEWRCLHGIICHM